MIRTRVKSVVNWQRTSVLIIVVCLFMSSMNIAESARSDDMPQSSRSQVRHQDSGDAEQMLADRYAPIVYLRQINDDICDTQNEGFDPVSVDFVLGREEIPLRTSESGLPSGPLRTVAESPTASDLYGLDQPHFLDFPGSPLRPRCVYRQYFADRLAEGGVEHVAYAHIYQEPGSDELALQYWMFYYFNDWNNNHEGDWEMIMLFFDADTAEEALTLEPSRLVYAQHGGGERAKWDDDKVSLEDGRPVVYSARGAHASFYEQRVYLGLVENGTGLGCETTVGPHRRLALDAIVVPHEPSGPDDPLAWVSFNGRWGEFRRSEWNGPTGPNDKTSWTEPVGWTDRQRDASLYVPTFEGFGQAPIDFFCGAIAGGSRALVVFTAAPMLSLGVFGLIVVLAGWIFTYASSSVRNAFSFYRRHFKTFALIGAVLIPTGYVVAVLQTLLFRIPPIGPLIHMMDRFPGVRIVILLMLGSAQAALAVIFIAPAVIWTVGQIRSGRTPGVVESFQHGVPAILPILIARLKVTGRVILYAITIVGIPWALLRIVRAIYLPQAVIYEGDTSDEAITDSAHIANVSLPRSVLTQLVLTIVTVFSGPLIAIFLLLAIPSRPIALVNYVSSVMFAFLYPVGVIGMTLLYLQLRPQVSSIDRHSST